MYVIIVGAGDIGTPLIEIATQAGCDVVVIERNERRAKQLAGEYDCLVINTDATTKEALVEAGADRADALVSTTDQDATNIMVCLLANELEIPNVVSVVHEAAHISIFDRIGVTTMENPQRLIAESLFRSVDRPTIVDYMRVGERAEVFEIDVAAEAPIKGERLKSAAESGLLGDDTLIIAIDRDGVSAPITPKGNTRLEVGDRVTVYSGTGATPDVTDVFGHYEDHTSENGIAPADTEVE